MDGNAVRTTTARSELLEMHFDGSKTKMVLGAGIVLTSPKRDQLRYVLKIHFAASNNVAEYEALFHGIKVAKEIGIKRIMCFGDSDLVIQQVSGHWDALDANMALYRFHVQQISGYFDGCEFHHIPRAENEAADVLSKLGSSRQAIPPGVALQHLRKPSITPSPESESIRIIPVSQESEVVPMDIDSGVGSSHSGTDPFTSRVAESHSGTPQVMSAEHISAEPMDIDVEADPEPLIPTWAQPIFRYLKDGTLPSDEMLARQTARREKVYTIINKELYKRSV